MTAKIDISLTRTHFVLQAKAEERVIALEQENVVLRVQAADSAKRVEELQQQLSACQVIHPALLSQSCTPEHHQHGQVYEEVWRVTLATDLPSNKLQSILGEQAFRGTVRLETYQMREANIVPCSGCGQASKI